MKILVLSFYYPPDLSAGSFRTASFVERLRQKLPPGSTIDVITTQPNRYHALAKKTDEETLDGELRVRRIELPPHRSGMVDQAKAFVAYFRGVNRMVSGQRYELVYGTSSRLFTAALAARTAKRVGARLYLDIRDIFVDTIKDVLPGKFTFFGLPVLKALERWVVGRADGVNLVSAGFLSWYQTRFPKKRFDVYPNGIDDVFLNIPVIPARSRDGRSTVLYAGNLGEGQGLHLVLPALARRCQDTFDFLVVGDGGRREALVSALAEAGVSNVVLRDPVPREQLIPLYQSADVLFLHLNDYDAFRKVLPSKLFEYAALGKPILAGVAGYAKSFVEDEVPNAEVFSPCNAEEGEAALRRLALGNTDRLAFVEKYRRANTMDRLADIVLATANTR